MQTYVLTHIDILEDACLSTIPFMVALIQKSTEQTTFTTA